MRSERELSSIKGLSEAKIVKLREAAEKTVGTAVSFLTGTAFAQRRQRYYRVTTGCKELDASLQGGIESGAISELFGEFRCGKSQLCMTLCVSCQLPMNQNGGNGKAIYIDTDGAFRPERITSIAERYAMEPEACLDNISVARVHSTDQLFQAIKQAAALMSEGNTSLLVIDSATMLFRTEYTGRGELADRQQRLGKMLKALLRVSEEYNVAVVITNQVMATPDAMAMGDPRKPIGGHILAHMVQYRLYSKKGRGENRICKIFDAPGLPEVDATFSLGSGGVEDAKD